MMILSLILNIIVVLILSKKFSYSKVEVLLMVFLENFGCIFGGKLFTFLLNGGEFDFFKFGFSSFGGLFGGLFVLFLYSIFTKTSFRYILLLFVPSIPLIYSLGKIGCFCSGCCYGIPYSGLFHVIYHKEGFELLNVKLFPIQIIESIVFFVIFVWFMYIVFRKKINLCIILYEIFVCSFFKFILDFFRYNHTYEYISKNQLICLVLMIITFVFIINEKRKMKLLI